MNCAPKVRQYDRLSNFGAFLFSAFADFGFRFNCQAEVHPGQFDFDLSKGACQLPAFLEGDSFYL